MMAAPGPMSSKTIVPMSSAAKIRRRFVPGTGRVLEGMRVSLDGAGVDTSAPSSHRGTAPFDTIRGAVVTHGGDQGGDQALDPATARYPRRMARGRTETFLVTKVADGEARRSPDELVVEEPLEIRLDDQLVATTM